MIKLGSIPQGMELDEAKIYLDEFIRLHPEKKYTDGEFNITIQGDDVDLWLNEEVVPFQRIRRITGYLVGTLDRFNDAKKSEVNDRVKHGIM